MARDASRKRNSGDRLAAAGPGIVVQSDHVPTVAVSMLGGDLMIDGDAVGNSVMVSELTNGGDKIAGKWTDGDYTTIKGQTEMTVDSCNGMYVNLDDGNDLRRPGGK